jgi:hypothetical protein
MNECKPQKIQLIYYFEFAHVRRRERCTSSLLDMGGRRACKCHDKGEEVWKKCIPEKLVNCLSERLWTAAK